MDFNTNKILRVYVSNPIPKHILDSQILGWDKFFNNEFLFNKYIFFHFRKYEFPIENLIDIKVFKVHKFILFRDFEKLFYLYRFIKNENKRFTKIILQTRDCHLSISLFILKKLLNIKIIYDAKAGGEHGDNSSDVKLSILKKLKIKIRHHREKLMLNISDKVFCVSQCLIDYFANQYNIKNLQEYRVFYNVPDSDFFYYNPKIRIEQRNCRGFTGQILVLYSGGLSAHWQIPDIIFKFIRNLINQIPQIYTIILTPDKHIAYEYKKEYKISDSNVLIKSIDYKSLVKYYNLADVGLLLRDNNIINKVSSPIKFSEYINCGLPVIITQNIQDYANITSNNNLGFVLKEISNMNKIYSKEFQELVKYILSLSTINKRKISEFGFKYLSKQNLAPLIIREYHSLD